MPSIRYPLIIERDGDEVLFGMDFGALVRVRRMPTEILKHLLDACQQVKEKIVAVIQADEKALARIPTLPGYVRFGCANIGACDIHVGASKDDAGTVEFMTELYDSGDDSAPVILLVNEQVDQFIARATKLIGGAPNASLN
jgi:hypothetical protein